MRIGRMSAIAMVAFCTDAMAFDGNSLYAMCDGAPGSVDEAACVAYIGGFRDGMELAAHGSARLAGIPIEDRAAVAAHIQDVLVYCIPNNAAPRQIVDVVRIYLRDHPAERHRTAFFVTGSAFLSAFPCP